MRDDEDDQQRPGDPPVITLAELMRRLSDETTPLDDVRPYLIPVPDPRGGMAPGFQPNPSRVTGLEFGLEGGALVGTLNAFYQARRQRAYRERIAGGWGGPRIVAEGDSWFQYPLLLEDIIDHLARDHAVLCFSAAGDTLDGMTAQNQILPALAREGAAALLFSAGGNDLFGEGQMGKLVEPVFPGATAPELVGARFEAFAAKLMADYRRVLLKIHAAHPRVHIFIHGYSAAFSRMDRWVGGPLKAAGVMPVSVQNRVVEVMVERWNALQKRLAADPVFGGKLHHIDLTGLGRRFGDWYDEIHMGSASNAQAAALFAEALKRHLPAGLEGLEGGLESGAEGAAAAPEAAPVEAIAAHARDLSALGEAMLLAELDRRVNLLALDPSVADRPSYPLLIVSEGLEGGVPAPGRLARRLLRRWEREAHGLFCGDDAEEEKERTALKEALGLGDEALIGALAAWLVSGPLGVPAVLAGVLAAILVKRFGGPTAEIVCQTWKERLDAIA